MIGKSHDLIRGNTQHLLWGTKENHEKLKQGFNLGLFKYEAGVLTYLTSLFSPRAVGYLYHLVIADFKSPHTTGQPAGFLLKEDSGECWKNMMLTAMDGA